MQDVNNEITYLYFCTLGGLSNPRCSKIVCTNAMHVHCTYHYNEEATIPKPKVAEETCMELLRVAHKEIERLQKEKEELTNTLALFWAGSAEVDEYCTDADLPLMPDTGTWKELRRISHEFYIPGNYVYDGVHHRRCTNEH